MPGAEVALVAQYDVEVVGVIELLVPSEGNF